jgi:hypothetical protein
MGAVLTILTEEPDGRFFAILLVFYAVSFFYLKFPPGLSRELLHSVFGVCVIFWAYGPGDAVLCLIAAVVTYISVSLGFLWISVILAVFICEGSHILIVLRNPEWGYDLTAWTMVLMLKVISLAFNLRDARRIAAGEQLHPRWTSVAVSKMPSFTAYFAWVFTPQGNYSLPFIEYAPFAYSLQCRELKPNRRQQGLKKFFWSVVVSLYIAFVMTKLTWQTTYGASWFLALHPIVRSVLCPVFTGMWLTRYFAATILVDAVGFNTGLFDCGLVEEEHMSNHDIIWTLKNETVPEWYQRWNHTTHIFFKYYLAARLLEAKIPKAITNWSVYIASMLWHGVRPVYLSLLPEAVLIGAMDGIWEAKLGKRWQGIRRLLIPYGNLYVNCAWFFPTWENVIGIRKLVWFWPTVTWVTIGVLLSFVKPKKRQE